MNSYTPCSPFRRALGFAGMVLALSGLFVPTLTGCGSSELSEASTSTTLPDSLGMFAPPGLYDLEGGRTQAFGVLVYRDLEGGFWAVVDAQLGEPNDKAPVIAVLVGAEELGVDLATLEGGFVLAEGRLSEGASVRMAGTELLVDTVREATDTIVLPAED
jgi:hypothetical protein